MENENKMTINVGELNARIFAEMDRVTQDYTNNTAKQLRKLEFVLKLLENVPESVFFTLEGVRGNEQIRDYYLPNMGSVVECIIKYFQTHEQQKAISKSFDGKDTSFGWCAYEVKASLSANSLATPSEKETTLLVNRCGIFSLKKAEVMNYVNKQGRLPHNVACGKPVEWLMRKMGFEAQE